MNDFTRDPIINVINNGIKRDIRVALDNGCHRAAVTLIYSGIDAMAGLTRPEKQDEVSRNDFISWADRYIKLKHPKVVTGSDLYGARCAILHTYGPESRMSKAGLCKRISYMVADGPILYSKSKDPNLVVISVSHFADAFFAGIDKFLVDVFSVKATADLVESRLGDMYHEFEWEKPFCDEDSNEGVKMSEKREMDIPNKVLGVVNSPTINEGWMRRLWKWADDNGISDETIPRSVCRLLQLTTLDLSEKNLCEIPPEIGALTNLRILNIGQNRLTGLPDTLCDLCNLRELDVWNNALIKLPVAIGNLKNLRKFSAEHIKLNILPETIGRLRSLTMLSLWGNNLTELPESIGRLTNLRELNIGANKFTKLPESIGNLKKLTALKMDYCELIKLPESIGALKKLKTLNVSFNSITQLPESMYNLENLTYLDVVANPLSYPPVFIGCLEDRGCDVRISSFDCPDN